MVDDHNEREISTRNLLPGRGGRVTAALPFWLPPYRCQAACHGCAPGLPSNRHGHGTRDR